jgi:hypothetical protein
MPGIKAVEDRYSYWGIRGPKRKALGQEHAFSIDGSRAGLRASRHQCTKSVTGVVALLRILAGCAKRRGRIPAVVFDR